MSSAEKIAQKQLDYYNAHDLDNFLSVFKEDVEILNLADNSLIMRGRDAMKPKYHERLIVQKVHAELVNRIVIGNKVIDHEHVSGIKKDEIVKVVAIYEVIGDMIEKVWFIYE